MMPLLASRHSMIFAPYYYILKIKANASRYDYRYRFFAASRLTPNILVFTLSRIAEESLSKTPVSLSVLVP